MVGSLLGAADIWELNVTGFIVAVVAAVALIGLAGSRRPHVTAGPPRTSPTNLGMPTRKGLHYADEQEGDHRIAAAHTAQANLPEEFDTENDRDLLAQHGIDVEYLLSRR